MRRLYASLVLLTVILSVGALPVTAQNDDLQDYINSVSSGSNGVSPQTRATTSDGFTIVDLSQFSATNRTKTLQVTNGQKIRFVNGTLTRGDGLVDPVLKVDGGSVVEISSSDGTYKTSAEINNETVSGGIDYEAVLVHQGTIKVKNYGWIDGGTESYTSGTSVMMTSNNSAFFLEENGCIIGPVVCSQYANAKIEVSGGRGHSGGADWCKIQTYSDIVAAGNVVFYAKLINANKVVKLTSKKTTGSYIEVNNVSVGRKVAEGYNGYILTEEDRRWLNVVDSKGTKLNTYLKDNAIYIGETDDLQTFINNTPTNASSYTEVNLSNFNAINRSKTLYITDGRKIKFVSGVLTRTADLKDGPLVLVSNNAEVSMEGCAFFKGGGFLTGNEIVRLDKGTINIGFEGVIDGHNGNGFYDPAVVMTSDADKLYAKEGAFVYGSILNENETGRNNVIEIGAGAKVMAGSDEYGIIRTYSNVEIQGSDNLLKIDLLGKDNIILLCNNLKYQRQLVITAPAKTYNDRIVIGGAGYIIADPSYAPDRQNDRIDGNSDGLYMSKAPNTLYYYTLTEEDHEKIIFVSNDDNCYSTYLQNNAIYLYADDLQCWINGRGKNGDDGNGNGTEDEPYKNYVPCSGIDVNSDVKFNGDDLQYYLLYGKMPAEEGQTEEDCEGTVRQNDGDVYIDKGSTVTFKEIYWHGCGCSHYIYVSGTLIIDIDVHIYNYLRFIHVLPGGRVIIRGLNGEVVDEVIYVDGGTVEYHGGDTSGGKYGWYCVGGVIYIYNGTIKGGTCGGYTGKGGTTHIYGGTIYGGIINYGTTYIHGGNVSGGSSHTIYNYKGGKIYIYGGTCSGTGTVWNEGDLYLDGGNSVSISDVYVIRGCHIYILSRLTYILRLHITVENIVLNTPIILGGDGYRLTEEDCGKLQIDLPDGYAWRFDQSTGGIIIYSLTGIESVDADAPKVVDTFDMTGRKLGEARKGINVERMSDGTVRKVVVK